MSEKALEQRARRAARRIGLIARKSRRATSLDNLGGFAIVDQSTNGVINGSRFELSAEEVVDFCTRRG